jgi:hypothetical protein
MIEQSVIRILLLAVLVRHLTVCWYLVVRDWPGWEHLGRWKKPKRRKRQPKWYKKPKPFEGLTRKPVCAGCAIEEERGSEGARREPPPRIERTRGRRPEIDTSGHFYPGEGCRYYGWLDRGNIVSNGHPGGGPWRQLYCVVCGKYFQETLGTLFYGSSAPAQDIIRAYLLNNWGKPAQAPVSGAYSPQNIEMIHPGHCSAVRGSESTKGGADLGRRQGHRVELAQGGIGTRRNSARVRDTRTASGTSADGRVVRAAARCE